MPKLAQTQNFREKVNSAHGEMKSYSITDWVVLFLNFNAFFLHPRRLSNFRWANILRDASCFIGEFSSGQFFKIYGRTTARYRYHKLQRHESSPRRFDVTDALAQNMKTSGNHAFYTNVCGEAPSAANFSVDLTEISDISGLHESADYLHRQIAIHKGQDVADKATKYYLRGYSRAIEVQNDDDWEKLRDEIANNEHLGTTPESMDSDDALLVAVSYKGDSVKITRRMRPLTKEGVEDGPQSLQQEDIQLTSYFINDFRWSQLVRSCMGLARSHGASKVKIWIDRLVGMDLSKEERDEKNSLEWTDYGLFAYAVCPVVRLYETTEPEYGTDFWRKLETCMGVAGKGLIVDDYMLSTYDYTIFYGKDIYQRLSEGLALIGGTGKYIRSVTLALATAILTDGISASERNEDMRTRHSIPAWKAWALRTIAEGAYSANHFCMLKEDEPFALGYSQFLVIAFWESMVSRSRVLQGNSYLDMSLLRSVQYRKTSKWDGIEEWIGMVKGSFTLHDRERIMDYLRDHVSIQTYVATSGHAASLLELQRKEGGDKRTIVANLSRFSTTKAGHVVAVAEATGLRGKLIMPWWLRHIADPDSDQIIKWENLKPEITYENMKVELVFQRILVWMGLVLILIAPFLYRSALALAPFLWGFLFIYVLIAWRPWPWRDNYDVGEAVFDNVLMHGLYKAGIKTQYRKLRERPYDELGWR